MVGMTSLRSVGAAAGDAADGDVGSRVTRSAAVTSSRVTPDPEAWLADRRSRHFAVDPVPFAELDGWSFDPDTGNLAHDTGRFITVEGLRARTNAGAVQEWEQPIIIQRDIAILGILAKEFDGVLHFLMFGKMEPGNLDMVQLSPTVQATSSNYTKAHQGARPPYVEFFEERRGRVLVDVLQSEQGSWFHQKRNRNIVLEVDGDVPEHEDYCWLTLGQIRELLHRPHRINMDARTVLAGLPVAPPGEDVDDGFGGALRRSLAPDAPALHSAVENLSWFTERKCSYSLDARLIPLAEVQGWEHGEAEIAHPDGRFFRIVGVRVEAGNREVTSWGQPLLAPRGLALAGMVVRRFGGVLHALVQADVRPGHRDVVELSPTVLATPGNHPGERPEFLDFLLSARDGVRYDVVQSEEGGRFLHAATRYLVVEVGDEFPVEVPADFRWMTFGQLLDLQRHSYHLTIECRSSIFCLNSIW